MANFATRRGRLLFILERRRVDVAPTGNGDYRGVSVSDREALSRFGAGPEFSSVEIVRRLLASYDIALNIRETPD
jgi:hypothetical protein